MYNSSIYRVHFLRNEFHFSEVYRSVNYIGSRAKFTWTPFSKCKLHWVAFKVNEPRRGSCKLCTHSNVVYTSINIRKLSSLVIFIHFNPNVDEKSDISAKIEAGKHLYADFLLTAEQRQWRHDVADVQSDCREPWFILTSFKVMLRRVAQCN